MKKRANSYSYASALRLTVISLLAILPTLTTTPARAQIGPSWTATGSMNTARYDHTATLLPSGKVLVASLGTARDAHTATLLPSGKVLVAGGRNSAAALGSAELYDPAAGTWTTTGNLGDARYWYTATLLPSGKVLGAGGVSDVSTPLRSAELYDPATGTWTATASLGVSRFSHTATLLLLGKVLVAGGYKNLPLSSAEVYTP